jgi:hypothetical protein
MQFSRSSMHSDLHKYTTRVRVTFSHDPPSRLGGSCSSTSWDSEWQLATNVWMALCIEYSPGSWVRFPTETQHSQLLYAKDVDCSGQASTITWLQPCHDLQKNSFVKGTVRQDCISRCGQWSWSVLSTMAKLRQNFNAHCVMIEGWGA